MYRRSDTRASRSHASWPRGPTPSLRQLRVGENMRRILAEILRLGNLPHQDLCRLQITVTEVRVSPDLSNASIFLLPFGGEENQAALNALEQSRGLLRAKLAAQMRLKRTPALNFAIDRSFDNAREIDRLLRLPKVARDLQTQSPRDAPLAGVAPSGWLILDKPPGMTSARAVAKIKLLSGAAKAGHCGTLDPSAEGLLPIALGEATKLTSFVADAPKTYLFAVFWGAATSSDDSEGEVVARSPLRPNCEDIRIALQGFLGEKEQIPPRYSAVHVSGTRAYKLARTGQEFHLVPRQVCLYDAKIVRAESGADTALFEITCSKGYYVRSLARDLGKKLGTLAHVKWLRRIRVGMFTEEMSIPLEVDSDLRHNKESQDRGEERRRLLARLQPVESVLENVPTVSIDAVEEARLRQGQPIILSSKSEQGGVAWEASRMPLVALREGRAVALLRFAEGESKVWPVRVLHPDATTRMGG